MERSLPLLRHQSSLRAPLVGSAVHHGAEMPVYSTGSSNAALAAAVLWVSLISLGPIAFKLAADGLAFFRLLLLELVLIGLFLGFSGFHWLCFRRKQRAWFAEGGSCCWNSAVSFGAGCVGGFLDVMALFFLAVSIPQLPPTFLIILSPIAPMMSLVLLPRGHADQLQRSSLWMVVLGGISAFLAAVLSIWAVLRVAAARDPSGWSSSAFFGAILFMAVGYGVQGVAHGIRATTLSSALAAAPTQPVRRASQQRAGATPPRRGQVVHFPRMPDVDQPAKPPPPLLLSASFHAWSILISVVVVPFAAALSPGNSPARNEDVPGGWPFGASGEELLAGLRCAFSGSASAKWQSVLPLDGVASCSTALVWVIVFVAATVLSQIVRVRWAELRIPHHRAGGGWLQQSSEGFGTRCDWPCKGCQARIVYLASRPAALACAGYMASWLWLLMYESFGTAAGPPTDPVYWVAVLVGAAAITLLHVQPLTAEHVKEEHHAANTSHRHRRGSKTQVIAGLRRTTTAGNEQVTRESDYTAIPEEDDDMLSVSSISSRGPWLPRQSFTTSSSLFEPHAGAPGGSRRVPPRCDPGDPPAAFRLWTPVPHRRYGEEDDSEGEEKKKAESEEP